MAPGNLTMLAVGDLMVGAQGDESLFALAAPVLKTADVLVGQGETLFSTRSVEKYYVEVPTEFFAGYGGDPSGISALVSAGFHVITLAGNHIWDSGAPGIEDTVAGLQSQGIAVVGAGMNIEEARRPAIVERAGTRFGFLNYNCAGPKLTWATPEKPGNAYVHVVTAYELEHPTPGGNPTIYTFAEPRSLGVMIDDIQKLRSRCDVLVVCFHKGIGFVPAKLAMYEQQVSYSAIDAGADVVIGHHAHLIRGIEFYKGRPIFHGLGHFVLGQQAFSPSRTATWARDNFLKKTGDLFGPYFETSYHLESMKTMIAKCNIVDGKVSRVSYFPCLINQEGQAEVIRRGDERGQGLFDYMISITRAAELNARYEWDGDEVVAIPDTGL